jgi:phage protein D/phage baseplate assembly protein gpV
VPDAALAVAIKVEVDGQPLAADVETALLRVVVDDHLHLPDAFELTFQETPDMAVGEKTHLRVGGAVKVSATGLGDATPSLLISGEVTSLEGAYREGKAPVFVARGYDHAHRLSRGRRSATFRNVKYSDIAQTIASQVGLQAGTIDDSGEVHEHVGQTGETDWEFLRGLAREVGFEVAVVEAKLDFRRPSRAAEAPERGDFSSTDPLQLVFGQDLLEFRPRVTSSGQVVRVEVRGWDPTAKQAVVGTAQAGTTAVQLPDDPGALAGRFGSPVLVVESDHQSQAAADRAATALAEQIGSAFAEASGIARGNPRLKAGAAVSVAHVAAPFAGRYALTHTRHTYDQHDGYRTQFTISGRQDRSLMGLVAGAAPGTAAGGSGSGSAAGPASSAGVVVAVVTDNGDPDRQGRVKLRFPALSADYESDWTRVAAPGNGASRGTVWIPEVNDEVLVAFENGDRERPFVVGGLWNGVDTPPEIEVDNGKLEARSFVSRTGQKIVLSDKDGSEGILISSADGSIVVHVDAANKKVAVNAEGSGTVEMKTGGDFTIDCQGSVKIKGLAGVEISSTGETKVSGDGQLSLASNGIASVKAQLVSLG